jgi:hypothetical protein
VTSRASCHIPADCGVVLLRQHIADQSTERTTIVDTTLRAPRVSLLRAVGLELLVVGALIVAYRYGRLVIGHSGAAAFDNASDLIGWERALRLPNELAVQQVLLSSEWVTRAANVYYAAVHFPLTAGFLIWLFAKSREQYARIRTSMAILTGLALVIHAAFPLAPARMLDGLGFVDTAARYGPTVYSQAPQADSVANQFAAMPSLHFGWAVMVAIGIARVGRTRLRWLWVAHPVITLLVIVGTGNHYWMDAAVAAGLILLSERAVRAWSTAGRRIRPIRVGGPPATAAGPAQLVDGRLSWARLPRIPQTRRPQRPRPTGRNDAWRPTV